MKMISIARRAAKKKKKKKKKKVAGSAEQKLRCMLMSRSEPGGERTIMGAMIENTDTHKSHVADPFWLLQILPSSSTAAAWTIRVTLETHVHKYALLKWKTRAGITRTSFSVALVHGCVVASKHGRRQIPRVLLIRAIVHVGSLVGAEPTRHTRAAAHDEIVLEAAHA